MRQACAVVVLLFLLSLPTTLQSQDKANPKTWPVRLRGKHYQMLSTCDRKTSAQLLQHMDRVFVTYNKLLALSRPPIKKMTIVLYKDRDEFIKKGEPDWAAAYYDGKHLVGYHDPERMLNYFAHEGFHQFTDHGLQAIEKAPSWFIEGMADCIGNSVVRRNRLFMCAKDGFIAGENLPVIQELIESDELVPLQAMLEMEKEIFYGKAGMYAAAWSFCHFLMTYPKYEETRSQIPNGKYWKVLSRYITFLSRSKVEAKDAWKASFVDQRGRPLSLATIEKEWKQYILKWPDEEGTPTVNSAKKKSKN